MPRVYVPTYRRKSSRHLDRTSTATLIKSDRRSSCRLAALAKQEVNAISAMSFSSFVAVTCGSCSSSCGSRRSSHGAGSSACGGIVGGRAASGAERCCTCCGGEPRTGRRGCAISVGGSSAICGEGGSVQPGDRTLNATVAKGRSNRQWISLKPSTTLGWKPRSRSCRPAPPPLTWRRLSLKSARPIATKRRDHRLSHQGEMYCSCRQDGKSLVRASPTFDWSRRRHHKTLSARRDPHRS
jgi:hypothetical protein